MERRLNRSRDDRMIWGVCGGIAKYFGIDPTVVRLITILLVPAGGFGILAYIILSIVVPLEASPAREPRDVMKENVEEMKQTATQLGEDIHTTFARHDAATHQSSSTTPHAGTYLLALVLIVMGIFFLLGTLHIFAWLTWSRLWPVVLIAIGLVIIFSPRRR